jgi:signal peptidase I
VNTILTPRFTPPRKVTRSPIDGLPDYVVATRGDVNYFTPPQGKKLVISQNGERLWFIVEADRRRGFAIGLHYETIDGVDGRVGRRVISHDEAGTPQHRLYQGRITFRLVPK